MRDRLASVCGAIHGAHLNRSYYSASTDDFVRHTDDEILGALTRHHGFALDTLQKNAWMAQISLFRRLLSEAPTFFGHIFFEFAIPRMGKRVDVVLAYRGVIFVVEFKVGEKGYPKYAVDQVEDYALDLKNFHFGSHDRSVVPILVATRAQGIENELVRAKDRLYKPLKANENNLLSVVVAVANKVGEPELDAEEWANSIYKPTPTIVEAAQALYRGHNVEDITRSDAGAINLSRTSSAIGQVIEHSKANGRKSICFVTGVPGSGKTLAGLNIANERHNIDEGEHAVFLSGNGPLVKVLREALARDKVRQAAEQGEKVSKSLAKSETESFIQNIHHFRDDNIQTDLAPIERVVIYDEAQRAWTVQKTRQFMKDKKGVDDFDMSEPEFLISVMDRHEGYAVIVCLVGGGQEINTGEAGLPGWFDALGRRYPEWDVYLSDQLEDNEYNLGTDLQLQVPASRLNVVQDMHLSVSVRSYRAERVSEFVKCLLDGDDSAAGGLLEGIGSNYPLVITRSLDEARRWLRAKARGTERFGIVASSGAQRLKPMGLHVKSKFDQVYWFLNDANDVRSSFYLEDVATEFDIQGLELDWACVVWDANFYRRDDEWIYRRFSGSRWQAVNDESNRLYLKNAYRVLLTRARQGMVILVPEGSADDPTRDPRCYDSIFDYVRQIGIPAI